MTSYFSFTGLTTDGTHRQAELTQTYGANKMEPDPWKFIETRLKLEQQTAPYWVTMDMYCLGTHRSVQPLQLEPQLRRYPRQYLTQLRFLLALGLDRIFSSVLNQDRLQNGPSSFTT